MKEQMVVLDLETTGLDPAFDHILEVACIFVDNDLEELLRYEAVLALPPTVPPMHPVVVEMHTKSGLLEACKSGFNQGYVQRDLEELFGRFGQGKKIRLVGQSVHFDLEFLKARMPWLKRYISHRIVDVSTIRDTLTLWDKTYTPSASDVAHRAMADCEMSLDTLRAYQSRLGE